MNNYNFILNGCDTDSIMFSKPDGSSFSKEEQERLLEELNSIFPERIKWEHDGVFPKVIYLKAKNYIMKDEKGKVKFKGSSLKSATLEPAIKNFLNEIIDYLLNTEIIENSRLVAIYENFIVKACSISDIKPWASKKSLSKTTFSSERANETKIIQAIQGTDYREGDKVWTFFKEDGSLELIERFTGDYDKSVMVEKLYKASSRFWTILDKSIFLNYSLKKYKYHLELLCGNISPGEFDELTKPKVKKAKKNETSTISTDS
jgi:hypothetical protein